MKASVLAAVIGFAAAVTACGGNDKPAEGPAEKAGKKVDQAGADTKEAAKDAADKVDQKADEAGEKIKEKTND